ncbi:MAG: tyrosine-type recombinase/integrase [Vulcanimicrobiota bacterium]
MKDDRCLQHYADGSWGVIVYLPPRYTSTGKRSKIERKIGTKPQARAFRDDILHRIRTNQPLEDGPPPAPSRRPTVGERLENYIEGLPKKNADYYLAKHWIETIGEWDLEALTVAGLRAIIQRWKERYAPATVHRKLDPLQRVYTLAVQEGVLPHDKNPFRRPDLLDLPKINNQREHPLTLEQEERLREVMGPWWPYLVFAILTGIRQDNQLGLRWDDVHFDAKLMILPTTKSGKRQPVILSETAIEVLRQQRELYPDSEWCFPAPEGGRWNKDNFRRRIWRPLFAEAGLPPEVRWHDLRHTAASRLVSAGVPLYTVQKMLGQADPKTTQRYAHLADEALRDAAELLAEKSATNQQRFTDGESAT